MKKTRFEHTTEEEEEQRDNSWMDTDGSSSEQNTTVETAPRADSSPGLFSFINRECYVLLINAFLEDFSTPLSSQILSSQDEDGDVETYRPHNPSVMPGTTIIASIDTVLCDLLQLSMFPGRASSDEARHSNAGAHVSNNNIYCVVCFFITLVWRVDMIMRSTFICLVMMLRNCIICADMTNYNHALMYVCRYVKPAIGRDV